MNFTISQCSKWYEISDMGIFQFSEENPDLPANKGLIPTQDTKPSLGRRPKDGFVSKWVYKFLPAKNLHTYQNILHSNIT